MEVALLWKNRTFQLLDRALPLHISEREEFFLNRELGDTGRQPIGVADTCNITGGG